MPAKRVSIGDLMLDLDNPRITRAATTLDALQKIVEDQDVKLVVLASSIVEEGLNPMDRLLVIGGPTNGKFTVVEGNRRLAALTILRNPEIMQKIEIRPNLQRRLAALAKEFDGAASDKLDVWLLPDRASAAPWLRQRHTGENQGAGIVDWNGVAAARFRGTDPALQALDLVLRHGGLTEEEKKDIASRFPITTLDRLLRTPDVRALLGLNISGDKLLTDLPATEVIKPLARVVRDLSNGTVNVTKLKLKPQQIEYAKKLGSDLPDLTKRSGVEIVVEALTDKDFGGAKPKPAPKPKPKPKPPVRKSLIPDECALNVTNAKIAEIEQELRNLSLSNYPHAISVLFRVFLEQSTEHYLSSKGIPLDIVTSKGRNPKNLRTKVSEAAADMIASGVRRNDLDGVTKGIGDKNSPLNMETLNNYVHNSFYSPQERELKVSWDNSRLYFEKIWS